MKTEAAIAEELARFERGELDPAMFPHAEHARLAFEMLRRHSFPETIARFSAGLKQLASKAGRPDVYHETITVAFLAVINERSASAPTDWPLFVQRNGDLLDKRCLEAWYDRAQLATELSRSVFCLPRKLVVPTPE
jgi:hypothetical protein